MRRTLPTTEHMMEIEFRRVFRRDDSICPATSWRATRKVSLTRARNSGAERKDESPWIARSWKSGRGKNWVNNISRNDGCVSMDIGSDVSSGCLWEIRGVRDIFRAVDRSIFIIIFDAFWIYLLGKTYRERDSPGGRKCFRERIKNQ